MHSYFYLPRYERLQVIKFLNEFNSPSVLTVNVLLNVLYIVLNSPFANDKLLHFPVHIANSYARGECFIIRTEHQRQSLIQNLQLSVEGHAKEDRY